MKTKEGELKMIPVKDLIESPFNPRGDDFDKDPSFSELVSSVKEKGVLVPILVRKKGKGYEVIAGNRRTRASKLAGLSEIPAYVTVMSDVEAREAQIVENLQRSDIHPLEEGMAYRKLVEESKPRYTVEDVGTKVGKSPTYVRERLLLTNLIPAAAKALRAGTIHAGHAALIARLSPEMQKQAVKQCEPEWNRETGEHDAPTESTVKELREWIQEQSWKDIANAPWKDDVALKAAYAGCEECAGKGGDLFGKNAAEACTNPRCYIQRALAYVQIKRTEDPTLALISGEYGKVEPFGPNKELVKSKSEYNEVQGKPKKCTGAVRAIVVSGEGIGHVKTVCWEPECTVHGSKYRTSYNQTPAEKARARTIRKKELATARATQAKHDREITALASGVKWPPVPTFVEGILELAFNKCGGDTDRIVAKKLGLESIKVKESWGGMRASWTAPLRKHAETLDDQGKVRLAFELFFESLYSGDGRRSKIYALVSGKRPAKAKKKR